MKNITCTIVDDEPYARELIKGYIDKTPGLELLSSHGHPADAIDLLQDNPSDLLFLDIEMPDINGMELATVLKNPPAIIFTTAYSEYAVESYEKSALDYLLKPITYERFLKSISKYRTIRHNDIAKVDKTGPETIFLKSESSYVAMRFSDIYYIEGLGDYVTFHTNKGRVVVYHTFKKLSELLPDSFIRTHYSYMVNFEHVTKAARNELELENGTVPVSRSYKKSVMKRIESRLL